MLAKQAKQTATEEVITAQAAQAKAEKQLNQFKNDAINNEEFDKKVQDLEAKLEEATSTVESAKQDLDKKNTELENSITKLKETENDLEKVKSDAEETNTNLTANLNEAKNELKELMSKDPMAVGAAFSDLIARQNISVHDTNQPLNKQNNPHMN